jgi:hypothetical protein
MPKIYWSEQNFTGRNVELAQPSSKVYDSDYSDDDDDDDNEMDELSVDQMIFLLF